MRTIREEYRIGVSYLEAATELLRRVRNAHPTVGLMEAADLHWWWRTPRSTDTFRQLFWFDDLGRPESAVIATDWGDGICLDPIIMHDATPNWTAHVIERGLDHVREAGFGTVEFAIDRADEAAYKVLANQGFTVEEEVIVGTWLAADARPMISPLCEDYRLSSRLDTMARPHHMIRRSGPDVEVRLRQTTLYRDDLDLLVLDGRDTVAAYGLFWFDPATATGLVEPMRTEEDHQRRGLARHLLTTGIDLLAKAGATRIKICFRPENPVARELYLGVGFKPERETVVLSRRVHAT